MPSTRSLRLAGPLSLAALAVLAGCTGLVPDMRNPMETPSVPPPDAQVMVPPSPEVRLVAAIEAQGCVLTADNVAAVLLAANMTQAELADVTPRLAEAGRVEVVGTGGIRVLTDRCA